VGLRGAAGSNKRPFKRVIEPDAGPGHGFARDAGALRSVPSVLGRLRCSECGHKDGAVEGEGDEA
jgi:hypothetical protein